MARCSQTPYEFIQGAYSPVMAVLCTEDAELVCQKNNLKFVELLRPFSQLTSEAHIRDPLNLTHPVKGWKLQFVELSAPAPSKDDVNKLLADVVSRNHGPERNDSMSVEEQKKASAPWFEAFRDCFIQTLKPSNHEFIRHFLGCLFVVSSNNDDPLNAFHSLSEALDIQQTSDGANSRWFAANIFKYYLMIHDVTNGIQNKAEGIYQSMKSYYGSSICHLLMINSRSVEQNSLHLPDPWSQFKIPTNTKKLDMVKDEIDSKGQTETKENNQTFHENSISSLSFSKNNAQSEFMGPLAFENEISQEPENFNENNVDGEEINKGTTSLYGTLISRAKSNNEQRGTCLTLSDHDRIKIFIHELAIRGLIPFIEKTMRSLYDQINARKGLHKSFFNVTKKWFSGGKTPGQINSSHIPGIIYENDSAELLWRKLGDLAFLVQNYELAYNSYHSAKRDFNANHAWLYFAGALEMASISAFMCDSQRQYPSLYMETSVSTYLDTCRLHQYATRATLFGVEAFKSKGKYLEAALALLKMTGEESDLLSAILLEQAAHCFLRTQPSRVRKYAFNMILAGHRYSKANQRKHALRCYKQSLFVYNSKSWRMAEDHIYFIIGRQSCNTNEIDEALSAYRMLLVGESLQSPEQQVSYLKEYLSVFQQSSKKTSRESLPILPLPTLHQNSIRILFAYKPSPTPPPQHVGTVRPLLEQAHVDNNAEKHREIGLHSFQDIENVDFACWEKIELETFERVNQRQATSSFRHFTPCLTNSTKNALKPRAVINETIAVEVVLKNSLRIPLTLYNMTLLWTFTDEERDKDDSVGNEFAMNDDLVNAEVIKEFTIADKETKPALLCVTPRKIGHVQITGIKYSLSGNAPVDTADQLNAFHVTGKLDISVCGPRLNGSKVERSSVMYGEDNRLNIVVVKAMPRLKVTFSSFPSSLLCGELHQLNVCVANEGEAPLHKLHVASTSDNLFAFDADFNKDVKVAEFQKKQLCRSVKRVSEIKLPNDCLNPGDQTEYHMWLQGSQKSGTTEEKLLFYYESAEENPSLCHRTVRHQSSIKTENSLVVRATAKRCKIKLDIDNSAECKDTTEDKDELVVTLEVENLSRTEAQHRTFSVYQVSCISKKWTLKPLSHHSKDGVITINRGETIITYFKAVRRLNVSDYSINHLTFTDKETDISSVPHWEFLCKSRTWKELNESEDMANCGIDVDLGLVVLWESSFIDSHLSKHSIHGQSEVAVVTLAESISAPASVQLTSPNFISNPTTKQETECNTELYIKYFIECPSIVVLARRFCRVTVNVIFHNCTQLNLKAFFELLEAERDEAILKKSSEKYSETSKPSSGHSFQYNKVFHWIGKRSRQLYLLPLQTMKLTFFAKVFQTGIFNLNACCLMVSNGANQLMVEQKPPPPCILHVTNTKENVESSGLELPENKELFLDCEMVHR